MLNDAIGGLLPSALAVALSRIPIVAIVLVLGAPNARMAGPALAVGWIAVLLSVSVNSDDPGLNWLNIAIGTLFLLMAAKQWTKRPNRYIRVSDASRRHGERFISPVEQREAIERWAAQRGFHLMEVLEELDESRARADRPLLERR